jgi:hypothetical protein
MRLVSLQNNSNTKIAAKGVQSPQSEAPRISNIKKRLAKMPTPGVARDSFVP